MTSKKLIVYLHGFNGSVTTPKVGAMRSHFKDAVVEAPTFNDKDAHGTFNILVKYFKDRIAKYDEIVVTGCSLGGFWAHYMSNQFKLPSLLMNPSMQPWVSLLKYVDKTFTQHDVEAFKDYAFKYALPKTVFEPRIVLLETGDNVLDYRKTQAEFTRFAEVRVLPGGSHRFDNFTAMNKAIEDLFNCIIH